MATAPYNALKVFEAFETADDRSVAIVGAAVVEDALYFAICAKLGLTMLTPQAEALREDRAPFGTFDMKIRFADSVGIFGQHTKKQDVDLIRKIRNDFAHNLNIASFTDNNVVQRIKLIEAAKSSTYARERPPNYRKMFTQAVMLISGLLIAEAVTGGRY